MHRSHQATTQRVRLLSSLVLTLTLGAGAAQAERTRYVDNALPYTCNDRYEPSARSCGPGSETGFVNLRGATRAAEPGDRFIVRAGTYREPLHLSRSGTENAPIVFAAAEGEEVILQANSVDRGEDYGPIWLDEVSHNVVSGFVVRGSVGFLRAVNAHHNIIRDTHFDTAELYPVQSKRGGLYFAWSHHNRIEGNTIIRGTDSLSLVASNYNIVEGNRFDTASHDIWNIKCGSYNVIRGNHFVNPKQKIGSVFDCELETTNWVGNGDFAEARPILDASHRNLIEGNTFARAIDYYSTSGGNGIQYAGQNGIIRHNSFYLNNVGLAMTHYGPEADFNYGNRVYNNVFHDNYCAGIGLISGDGTGRVEDNRYVNNVLWDNHGWGINGNCGDDESGQIVFRGGSLLRGHELVGNLIASPKGPYTFREEFASEGWLMADIATEANVRQTIEADPNFADAAARNYRPAAGSPMIDAGIALTTVSGGAGTGHNVAVADASYFYDGFGIAGEVGDAVQIGNERARIIGVDYEQNVISLDRDISWESGAAVNLQFEGAGPDLGLLDG